MGRGLVVMLNFLKRKTDLDRQMAEFFCYKASQSMNKAQQHSEFLIVFSRFVKKKNIYDVTRGDLEKYRDYLEDKYDSEYYRYTALNSLNGLLAFFRCGKVIRMRIGGRQANAEAIELVQGYREKGLTFRRLAEMMKKRGYTNDLKTLHFWAHYPLEKIDVK